MTGGIPGQDDIRDTRVLTRINQNIVVDANGGSEELIDEEEEGELFFIMLSLTGGTAEDAEVLLQLDGLPGPSDGWVSISELQNTYGLDEKIEAHWWVTNYDVPNTRYVIAYSNDNYKERYFKSIRLVVRNNTGTNVNVERIEIKRRVMLKEYTHEV